MARAGTRKQQNQRRSRQGGLYLARHLLTLFNSDIVRPVASRDIRKSARNALIASLLMIGLAFASAGAEFSRTETFSPIRLTYDDMAVMIGRIHQFVTTANASVHSDNRYREDMTIRGKLSQVRLEGDFSISGFAGAPEEAYSVRYLYSRDTAPISGVDIDLGDYRREVTVEGSSSDQVAALLSLLSEDLHSRETYLGGALFRIICGAILFGLAIVAPGVSPTTQTKVTRIALLITAALVAGAVWVLPWERWFPGTAVYSANASFLVRNSALISFIGTVAGLIALLSPLFRTILRGAETDGEISRKSKKSSKA